MEEELNKLIASVDTIPSKLVKPTPGKLYPITRPHSTWDHDEDAHNRRFIILLRSL